MEDKSNRENGADNEQKPQKQLSHNPSQPNDQPSGSNREQKSEQKLAKEQSGLKSAKGSQIVKKSEHKEVEEQLWETAYIDGKYYLSDPLSIAKLRQLDEQIELEKKRLQGMEGTNNIEQSFLSQQPGRENQNNENQALTQLNQSRFYKRKQKAEDDLNSEEEKYREKINEMKRRKSQIKKQLGCDDNEKNVQANEHEINQEEKSKNRIAKTQLKPEVQNSKKEQKQSAMRIYGGSNQPEETNAKKSQSNKHKIDKEESKKQVQNPKQKSIKSSIKNQSIRKQDQSERRSSRKSDKKQIQPSHKRSKQPSQKSNSIQKEESVKKNQRQKSNVPNEQNEKSFQKQLQPSENKSIKQSEKQSSRNEKKEQGSIKSKDRSVHQKERSQRRSSNKQRSQKESNIKSEKKSDFQGKDQGKDQRLQKGTNRSKRSEILDHIDKSKEYENSQKSKQQKSAYLDAPNLIVTHPNAFNKVNKSVQWEEIQISPEKSQSKILPKFDESNSQFSDIFKRDMIEKEKSKLQQIQSISKKQITDKEYSEKYKSEKQVSQRSKFSENKDKSRQYSEKSPSKREPSERSKISQNKEIDKEYSSKQRTQKEPSERSKYSQKKRSNRQSSEKRGSEKEVSERSKISSSKQQIQSFNERSQKHESRINDQSDSRIESSYMQNDSKISQKKSKSFIIHSKEKSRKSSSKGKSGQSFSNYEQKQSERSSAQKSESKVSGSGKRESQNRSYEKDSSREEIEKLHMQVNYLKEKLERVEEKQEKMVKFENNPSSLMHEAEGESGGNEPISPLKMNLTSKLRLQSKLSLEGSIVQFNLQEEKQKQNTQENQKKRLKDQIAYLRKVIRELQMEKIKSIDVDPNVTTSLKPEDFQRKDNYIDSIGQSKDIQKWKDSLNSDFVETKRNPWSSDIKPKFQDDAGKIVKNSPGKSQIQMSPKKYNRINAQRGTHWSEIGDKKADDDIQHYPLPLRRKNESLPMRNAKKKQLSKDQLMNKFDENQRNFQHFLQKSRSHVNEADSRMDIETPQERVEQRSEFNFRTKPMASFTSVAQEPNQSSASINVKRNFSEIIDKMKKQDPEDMDISVKQIKVNDLNVPQLPQGPNLSMSQQQLLQLARKTYRIFGIDIQSDQNQLCMKKYKNCVVFSINNATQTILWHYSGKFYMGGWKNSQPGQGQKTGEGLQYTPGKHIYRGQFLGGKKNGTGIMKLSNDNIYEGQWVDGVKNGRGVYFEASSGTTYSGEWKDGKRDGYGLLKFSDNQFYQGTFLRSIKHGYGIEKFANGDIYKGEYQKGKFHGKGKYLWVNGSSYEGTFLEGTRHGQGNWKSSRNAGDIYIGAYESDKKSGYGRYVWANGCVYEGYFKNDYKHGKGRLTYQDGKEIKGTWDEGNLVGTEGDRKVGDHQQSPLKKSIHLSSIRNSHQNVPHSNKFSYI